MELIEKWLERLGLRQYGSAFVQADIDPLVLPDLTEADLERLGVSLGHRKKLLRAIAALTESAANGAVAPPVSTPVPQPPSISNTSGSASAPLPAGSASTSTRSKTSSASGTCTP
jgi:hypothetical protein